ncbi:MAG: BMP family ABC transporter substrate-binding protein [Waddliaceae bacterium]|jgi:basic membrane protein A and related proteins|nr:BMP family ABC transporter substrate-binding protein [Waddliaceae bacterium]MBT3579163.1 BMP family ABC transporter substrate-binding protein [Waddliaceae bacterium]MBT4444319.1 BMP family ABC transporter substrate-binding protein [Waddliaceae bacterium]MBT6928534.1 BMP family ABC transporter substrate-binding protein [Waddliaceae bacterium]MBT7264872.1 BMP family ABC transporter substrate-binding protein [Waddliaceae bacterium]
MKRYFSLSLSFVLIALVITLSSFSWPWSDVKGKSKKSSADAVEVVRPQDTEEFKVALVLPSRRDDDSWSQSIYAPLRRIRYSGKSSSIDKFSVVEKVLNLETAKRVIAKYAEKGYDLVIAHSDIYKEAILSISTDFPDTRFAVPYFDDGDDFLSFDNIFFYSVASEEAGYVNGIIAGLSFDFASLGLITTEDDISLYNDRYSRGLYNGLLSASPGSSFTANYIQSPWYPDYSAEPASMLLLSGAQVLSGISPQALGALYVAESNDIFWLGAEIDNSAISPNNVIASQVYSWDAILNDMISLTREGAFGEKRYILNYRNGGIKTVFNEMVGPSEETERTTENIIKGIIDGYIDPLE